MINKKEVLDRIKTEVYRKCPLAAMSGLDEDRIVVTNLCSPSTSIVRYLYDLLVTYPKADKVFLDFVRYSELVNAMRAYPDLHSVRECGVPPTLSWEGVSLDTHAIGVRQKIFITGDDTVEAEEVVILLREDNKPPAASPAGGKCTCDYQSVVSIVGCQCGGT